MIDSAARVAHQGDAPALEVIPRVRFAPSPTGYFHVGSARTALYNWLFARRSGGTFILRIEDTDTERNREEWVSGIYDAMSWLGLAWDEGPYRQSEHRAHYGEAVERLVADGLAYYCSCTRDEVDDRAARRSASANPSANGEGTTGTKPGYDGFCRDRALASGPGTALRFRVDPGEPVVVHDVIRGDVVFDRSNLEDFVIVKATGDPLFVLANVVDDIIMGITHVIRGEDLLPTTPKGLLLWEALEGRLPVLDGVTAPAAGYLPVFAHLPMLVNEKRQKLSKRRDPVAIEAYRADGYLAEVMVGYLALLGWSPQGDREIISLTEMIEEFRLEDVNHSPAFFDVAKLTHFNGEAIRAMPESAFVSACAPWIGTAEASDGLTVPAPPWLPEQFREAEFCRLAPLVQTRVARLSEVPAMVEFLFADEVVYDPDSWDKAIVRSESAQQILAEVLESCGDTLWDAGALKEMVAGVGDRHGVKLAKAQAPVRVALTGRTVGPPLFESMELLGRGATLSRLRAALARLGDN